jgi:hypothetical protein
MHNLFVRANTSRASLVTLPHGLLVRELKAIVGFLLTVAFFVFGRFGFALTGSCASATLISRAASPDTKF